MSNNIVMEFLWSLLLIIVVWVVLYLLTEPKVESTFPIENHVIASRDERAQKSLTAKNDLQEIKTQLASDATADQLVPFGIIVGKELRTYVVHLPAGYQADKSWPLVLAFHSRYSSAKLQAKHSELNEAADRHGFVVVYPQATHGDFNAGSSASQDDSHKIDELDYVRKMLAKLKAAYSIDTTRVYAVGIGNGGSLCYQIGREMSGEIAAICSVGGDMCEAGSHPSRPVPILHIHGSADPLVPFQGDGDRNKTQNQTHRPIDEVLAQWRAWNHCMDVADETKEEEYFSYRHYSAAKEMPGAEVALYKIKNGGHCWPGGSALLPPAIFGEQVDAFNANDVIWKFFVAHTTKPPTTAAKP